MNHAISGTAVLGFVAFALVIAIGIGVTVASYLNEQTQTCTVQDKYAINNRDSATKFRVETSCGVMEVQDAWFKMKFDSADRYANLDINNNYELTTIGFRVPFLSMFPNIIEVS